MLYILHKTWYGVAGFVLLVDSGVTEVPPTQRAAEKENACALSDY